jgi:hypothetical protein
MSTLWSPASRKTALSGSDALRLGLDFKVRRLRLCENRSFHRLQQLARSSQQGLNLLWLGDRDLCKEAVLARILISGPWAFCKWRDDKIVPVICPTCQIVFGGALKASMLATTKLLCMGLFSIFQLGASTASALPLSFPLPLEKRITRPANRKPALAALWS